MKKILISILALVFIAGIAEAAIKSKKPKPPKTPELVAKGKEIYFERCSFCHGITGAGDGPAGEFVNPRPRNFQTNVFKFRSTESGALPLDEDLFETISKGVQGTAMQSFDSDFQKTGLSEEERWAVIYYIQTFSFDPDFSLWMLDEEYANSSDPDDNAEYRYNKTVKIGDPPPFSEAIVEKGKEVYDKAKCFQCHGKRGYGNGESAKGMVDDWKFPIYPRDLSKGWKYKGGTSVKEIFFRFTTGLNGTPMPSFSASVPEDERWALAHYVKTLIDEPSSEHNLKVNKVEGELPSEPDDPAWETANQIDVWLSGNVVIKPRWQNITIDMVRVKALFNENEIAFRMEWADRFENRVHESHNDMHQLDQTKPEEKGNLQTYVPIYSPDYKPGVYRDGLMLQFPVKIPQGTEKPHFLNGDSSHEVNLWWWRADYDKDPSQGKPVVEMNAKGFKKPFKTQADDSQAVASKAKYDDGVWSLVMKRSRKTEDKKDIQFEQGRFIPLAVNAWDGFNGDIGMLKSVSSWYFVYLEKPMSASVYVFPLIALLLTGAGEWYLRKKWNADS